MAQRGLDGEQAARAGYDPDARAWHLTATVLLVLAGVYNLLWGIVAVATDDWFLVDELLLGDYGVWGVVYIVLGLLALVAAAAVWRGSRGGIVLAVVVAVACAADALVSIADEPVWAVTALVVYGLVLYALVGRRSASAPSGRTP